MKLTNYVSPLLHCEIGIGNDMFQLLREVINEYIEQYAPGEESIRTSIPTLRQIIADTAQQRNEWDDSPEGLTLKTMKRAVATPMTSGSGWLLLRKMTGRKSLTNPT